MGLTSLNVQPRSLVLEKFARTFGRRSKMIQSDENGLEVLDNVMRFIFLIDDFIVVPMEEIAFMSNKSSVKMKLLNKYTKVVVHIL